MSEQFSSEANSKIARKLHGKFPKGDVRHWLARVKRADSKDFGIQILYRGIRHRFPLKTSNKEVAARKALNIYHSLLAKGWDEVLREHKPQNARSDEPATVGELLSEVEATAGFRPITFKVYSQSLRQIAAEIAEIGDQPAQNEDKMPIKDKRGRIVYLSRRSIQNGGRDAWLAKVEAVSLAKLDAESVQRWRIAYVEKAGKAPDARRRTENTASSLVRNARALFSERALQFVVGKLNLPDPRPFCGIKLRKKGNTNYQSKINAEELIASATDELSGPPFQIFTLAMLCGLRKREIDLLSWPQINFHSSQIRIERTEWFEPKSEDSIGVVDVEPELLALLRGWRAKAKGPFVIEPEILPLGSTNLKAYRCHKHFSTLYAWLRKHGVTANKPLHELRKELGALLASSQGIFAAQSVLRHAQISTTADYYADKKRVMTAGLGALLSPAPPKIISIEAASAEQEMPTRHAMAGEKATRAL